MCHTDDVNGKGLTIVAALLTAVLTLILAMLGWLAVEMRGLRSEIREAHLGFESRMDALERDVAVLLERTAPLAPASAKTGKFERKSTP